MALVALLAVAAAEISLPMRAGSLTLPGLQGRVVVDLDRYGIPRIRASDEADAAEALGFLHARDRMMQMDLMRRAASGRLAALIGPAALPLDETARVLGTEQAAQAMLASLSPGTRRLLDAYARGVNALIGRRGRFASPEYLLLGAPVPWRPVDSLLWAETMGLALSDNLSLELARLALSGHMTRQDILSLWPNGSSGAPVDQASLPSAGVAALAAATWQALPHFPAPFTWPNTASNEWAVDGAHSATGAPLLAGDPHLGYGLPCLWYLARIETRSGFVVGATAPGTPFVVLGQNAHLAWTFTTTGADTEDLFVEDAAGADHYQGPSGRLAFVHRRERITVAGQPDVVIDVRSTRHGPVLSDLPGLFGIRTVPAGAVIAAQIASLAPGNGAADGLAMLDDAVDVDAAGRAAVALTAPVQNLLAADAHRIALFTTGRVPVRRGGNGRLPADGANGMADWVGYASGRDLPRIVAPASGVLVNANEPVLGTGSSVTMSGDPYVDWRSRRIRALLDRPGYRFSVNDFASMQGDVASTYMADLLPILRATVPRDGRSRAALRLMAAWDGIMSADRPEPLIAHAWLAALDQSLDRATGGGLAAAAPLNYRLAALQNQATGCRPDCELVLGRTLAEAMTTLDARFGSDMTGWRWGDAHHAVFASPVWSRLPLVSRWLRASLPVGGDASTVDAQAALSRIPYDSVHGASYRGVYDLSDANRSRFIIATGQSGNPFSAHLLDLAHHWQQVDPIGIPSQAGAGSTRIVLVPGE